MQLNMKAETYRMLNQWEWKQLQNISVLELKVGKSMMILEINSHPSLVKANFHIMKKGFQ